MWRFVRYELRTTDVGGAEVFYRAIGVRPDTVGVLPAPALARGAPAHWLGHLGVKDPAVAAAALIARGAMPLGPPRQADDGRVVIGLRDPAGAAVALTTAPATPSGAGVVLHLLSTRAPERALATYRELGGWVAAPAPPLPPPLGARWDLAEAAGGAVFGAVLDVTAAPHIHDHWLFALAVPDLDAALARVGAAGGRVDAPTLVGAARWAGHCHDPQGAAFTLVGPR